MKLAVIHGQGHKGVTYTMTSSLVDKLKEADTQIMEFFLPKDGPEFCIGCNSCFLKGEEHCPSADKVQPIIKAMEAADVIILDTPNYAMEMSGAMKNLMDHFAYRWVTHRPSKAMFKKVAVTICSSAGAPPKHTTKSMARQLKWMGVPRVYYFPLISSAMGVADLKQEKKMKIEKTTEKIAKKVKKQVQHPHASIRNKMFFYIFRKMQMSPEGSWNPKDREWWVSQEWTKKVRPWK
ncbi:MAG: NAD(P)H-dependent oxidoreductase [bacterium]|nr:NAD(P)H-dependent oxidoreductase [bacterium]